MIVILNYYPMLIHMQITSVELLMTAYWTDSPDVGLQWVMMVINSWKLMSIASTPLGLDS